MTSIVAGTGLTGGTITTSGTIALNFANANSWTGLQTFANASSTLATLGTTWFTGNTNTLLSSDANGKLQNTTVSSPLAFSGGTLSAQHRRRRHRRHRRDDAHRPSPRQRHEPDHGSHRHRRPVRLLQWHELGACDFFALPRDE